MISLKNITLRRGTKVLLDQVSTTINPESPLALSAATVLASPACSPCSTAASAKTAVIFHPSQWRMAQVAQHMPETDESATRFVLDGDTRLAELNAQLAAAEASGDGMEIAQAYVDLADAGAHDAESRAQALILGLGFKVPSWITPSTASRAAGACACNWPAR
jgi:ATP-binding cassette subfamily F protein 3